MTEHPFSGRWARPRNKTWAGKHKAPHVTQLTTRRDWGARQKYICDVRKRLPVIQEPSGGLTPRNGLERERVLDD